MIKFVFGIAAPVPDGQIDLAITVEISRGNSGPAAGLFGQAPLGGRFGEDASVISEYAHGAPFGCECEVWLAIAIQVGEDRAINQADRFEGFAGGVASAQIAVVV